MNTTIYSKIEEANGKYAMFSPDDSILVALSGGADSVCLLFSLHRFYPKLNIVACHVNHMLRGDEADRDEKFVRELCEINGIILEVLKTDVATIAKEKGISTELAARKVRYNFFEEVCKRHGIHLVATAHTASDNAETVLFNLTRGTALSGLCGIPPKRILSDGIFLIRPLIFVTRDGVENYLADNGICYVTDSSNLTDDYTRNYFRHNIIPKLKEINPSFEESIKNTCTVLRDTQIFIDKTANNNMTDNIYKLAQLDDCVLSEVIVSLYKKHTNCSLMEAVHVSKTAKMIKKSASENCRFQYEICLPGMMSAIIKNNKLTFEQTVRKKKLESPKYSVSLIHGNNVIKPAGFDVIVADSNNHISPAGYALYSAEIIDRSKVCGQLIARNRLPGDTIKQAGMTKKVKELMCKSKVSNFIRENLPFICDDNGIIYIPGICVNDRHKQKHIEENNKLFIYIYIQTTL